jgi:hypothetical protein
MLRRPLILSKIRKIIYENHPEINESYKVVIESVDTINGQNCSNIIAKRVIVTVPVGVLRGNGYGISFDPPLNLDILPMHMGQYSKFFVKFKNNFWGNNQFLGILRPKAFQGVCSHWNNLDYYIPGSKMLMCSMTDEGMAKYISMNMTTNDLLKPLRNVYGTKVVNREIVTTYLSRWDQEPTTGYGSFSSFKAGYTLEDYYKFFGGAPPEYEYGNGEGVNKAGEWVVHIGGAASCFEYYEYVDGAYYAGQRSAGFVLQSLGYENVTLLRECDP